MDQVYEVKLEAFEGPLDLLLHLIHQYEIDIYAIPVAEITRQYMDYIKAMQYLELNIASEYLVMAATLVSIKSQMLLPKQQLADKISEYEEDPREELIERLLEYQKYKQVAKDLKEKEKDSNQIFTRPPIVSDDSSVTKSIVKGGASVYDMLGALNQMFQRKQWNEPKTSKIARTGISIEQRMQEVLTIVKNTAKGVSFDSLFTYKSRAHIVITFMAILELMKNNEVFCKQRDYFEVLYIYYQQPLKDIE